MRNFVVICNRYGYATVEAETEEDAIESGKKLKVDDFYWSDPEDYEAIEGDC